MIFEDQSISTTLVETSTNISILMFVEYQLKLKQAEITELEKIRTTLTNINTKPATANPFN